MTDTLLQPKTSAKFAVVKSYHSKLDGENIRLVMYRKGQQVGARYGVVMMVSNTVVAKDYQNGESNELRTFPGNEDSIIDWVPVQLANARYASILMALVCCDGTKDREPPTQNGAQLRLVTSST